MRHMSTQSGIAARDQDPCMLHGSSGLDGLWANGGFKSPTLVPRSPASMQPRLWQMDSHS